MNGGYGPHDANFACCGGCSSHRRVDGDSSKLPTGSKVFIWDIKLKTDPAPECVLTFPYDPALNEQVGDRRVRSGRLVGSSYPIDHDYDSLCCEQRGQCRALDEDASGACQCVARWGFTGGHCQYSSKCRVCRCDVLDGIYPKTACEQLTTSQRRRTRPCFQTEPT